MAAFKVAEELQVEVENEPGAMARVLEAAAVAGVTVSAFVGYAMGPEMGFVHFIPSDLKKAKAALKKAGFKKVATNRVVVGRVKDRRGEAARVARAAAETGINVEAAYATGTGKGTGMIVIAATHQTDVARLARALG